MTAPAPGAGWVGFGAGGSVPRGTYAPPYTPGPGSTLPLPIHVSGG